MELNDLLIEINKARTNPKGYSNKLIFQMSYISKGSNTLLLPSQDVIQLTEGFQAYHDGINYLKQCEPLPPLIFNTVLSFISVNEASIRSKTKDVSMKNTDRFKCYGNYEAIAEIVLVTQSKDYEAIIPQLVVSDGDMNRINRNILMSPDINMIGLGRWEYDPKNTLIQFIFAKNWKSNKYKKEIDEIDNDNPDNINKTEQEILLNIDKYEKEIDASIENNYDYLSRTEEKKLFKDNNKMKLIKKFHFVLNNNINKEVIMSKSFFF